MLAQNLKTPAELGLSDPEFDALFKTLRMLERNEILLSPGVGEGHIDDDNFEPKFFNMYHFQSRNVCGTASCICGWAEYIGKLPKDSLIKKRFDSRNLNALFDPPCGGFHSIRIEDITPDQAAIALRNYLTHGEPRWEEACSP